MLQNRAINLDLAAKIIIGDPTVDRTENAKFKSKCTLFYISIGTTYMTKQSSKAELCSIHCRRFQKYSEILHLFLLTNHTLKFSRM